MRFVNVSQIAVGVALALLGLLDIGDRDLTFDLEGDIISTVDIPPLYRLLVSNWALPIVALVMGLLWITQKVSQTDRLPVFR